MTVAEETTFTWLERSAAWFLRRARRSVLWLVPLPLVVVFLVDVGLLYVNKPLGFAAIVAACGMLAWTYGASAALRGRLGELEQAYEARDVHEVTRLRGLIAGAPETPAEHAAAHVGDAELMMRLDRFEEARAAYAQCDRALLPPLTRPGVLGAHGLATALAADAEAGVALIEEAIREADATKKYPPERRRYLSLRLGIALSMADRHEEAVAELEPSVAAGADQTSMLARSALRASRTALRELPPLLPDDEGPASG
ncbi:MAG: hypothetical protein JWP97_4778 [Labilithrix sp.]|nr:hypothetical protein [Labilithrix sp.]